MDPQLLVPQEGTCAPGAARITHLFIKTQILTFVNDDANLLQAAVPPVIPQQPFRAVEEGVRLVTGVVVPFVLARKDDGIARMPLPVGYAIPAAGQADPRGGFVLKSDVKHQVPTFSTWHAVTLCFSHEFLGSVLKTGSPHTFSTPLRFPARGRATLQQGRPSPV